MGYTVECPSCCCDCNCGISITAAANGGCGGGTQYKVYLSVDGTVYEDGPSQFPSITKTYTSNPGEICAWWNETDTSSGQASQSYLGWFGPSEYEVDPANPPVSVEKCLETCAIASGATNLDATINIFVHQNVLGTEEGLIELTSVKLTSGAWTGAELLGAPVVVDDFATDHPNDSIFVFSTGELTPARANALCVLMEFDHGAAQMNTGFVELDRIDCFIDFETASGSNGSPDGFVFVGVDNSVDAPRCELISCGNPQSPFGRLCPAEHVTDDVEDQSAYTPTECFTVTCECPAMSMAAKSLKAASDDRKEALANSKIKKRKKCCGNKNKNKPSK